MSLEFILHVIEEVVIYWSRWYTERTWTHLLYLTSSHAFIYVKNQEHMRTIRMHSLLLIRAKHWTIAITHLYQQSIQHLHDISQEQNKIIQYNHTLSFHHVHLSFITYFFAWWMIIIKQKNIVFNIIIMSIMNAKKLFFIFVIKNWKLKHRCIEYHQWRAEQEWCITTNNTNTH